MEKDKINFINPFKDYYCIPDHKCYRSFCRLGNWDRDFDRLKGLRLGSAMES